MTAFIKKIVSITFLLSLAFRAFAPVSGTVIIMDTTPVKPFKELINAIGMVETRYDTLAYNPDEDAVGYFQIRPIRLLDFNKRTGSKYSMNDMFKYNISEKVFLYYANELGPWNLERIARDWNGSGKNTILYWNQVKKYLN
jgi:hypothetical protein